MESSVTANITSQAKPIITTTESSSRLVLKTTATHTTRTRTHARSWNRYCEGGVITCGMCLGEGNVIPQKASGGDGGSMASQLQSKCKCPNCGGIGVVACVNCKGEGVTIPIMLQRKQNEFGSVDEFDIGEFDGR